MRTHSLILHLIPNTMSLLQELLDESQFRGKIEYLHYYYKVGTPEFGVDSRRILDFKEGKPEVIEYYLNSLISTWFSESGDYADTVFCRVPSSNAQVIESSLNQLIYLLISAVGGINGGECLQRHKSIKKLANGGNRDVKTHMNSISVNDASIFSGKDVVLFDDVATTGHSLYACKKILREHGAKSVRCIVLALTNG